MSPRTESESSFELVLGFVLFAIGALLSFILLRFVFNEFVDWLTPPRLSDGFVRLLLSVVLLGAGWLASRFRKRERKAYAVVEIVFALAVNWVALNRLGTDLVNEAQARKVLAEPPVNRLDTSNTVGVEDKPQPTDPPPPMSSAGLLVIASLGGGLYLVGRGFTTLTEDGTEKLLMEVHRLGQLVSDRIV
jgi:hypothetical protein